LLWAKKPKCRNEKKKKKSKLGKSKWGTKSRQKHRRKVIPSLDIRKEKGDNNNHSSLLRSEKESIVKNSAEKPVVGKLYSRLYKHRVSKYGPLFEFCFVSFYV
jgi:hypothetical protein